MTITVGNNFFVTATAIILRKDVTGKMIVGVLFVGKSMVQLKVVSTLCV